MEKIFNAKWWDYSNEPLNINGRVCIGTAIPFGILGYFVLYPDSLACIGSVPLPPDSCIIIARSKDT